MNSDNLNINSDNLEKVQINTDKTMKTHELLKEKFIKLYDKYHENIYRFLYFRVKDEETAQDLTSETFVKSWDFLSNAPDKYPDNPQAFLYRVARNLLTDYYRSATKNREFSIGDQTTIAQLASTNSLGAPTTWGNTTGVGATPVVEEELDMRQGLDKVLSALQDMSKISAEVITLKYVEDMTNSEIAEVLGKSEGAVRTAVHRALGELRKHLTAE